MSRMNDDGLFWKRFAPAFIAALAGASVAVAGSALVFWADSRATDRQTADAIKRLDGEVAQIKEEAKEARKSAADDRQKTTEIAGDVRNLVRSNARIEQLLDRYLIQGPPPRQP